ncbi:nicotinate-nucleotide--dimethylbenzimidazole phosphoribosyltransferase [Corynebacterium heidelbergense]|uniref:Nicotinate-nucleotide--dimethylbenzimidazole phosphoribosyltransferase n=1 Tax=Corynebacterium heidelbergense TaxID=2055947 RepID=A0A364VDC2_9CORY|nr:nicotinate-nucleotide--dimethylbenzimidazole phosphoribosyltransferase [Corynebacterium heidelbergense]RAV34566.1 nicotinate-nucleotide--dimethylbenzimidazole phosphoribosyltransferase [Corynebacterium heidelbergense]WCZ36330.1 Nicotinate-nucleotide--dimethylbenzimidazole phosphoribosyltransferase [Corynebacterium heidelbergense]
MDTPHIPELDATARHFPSSLGLLGDLAGWLGACGLGPQSSLSSARLLLLVGDDPRVAASPQISALPEDYAARFTAEVRSGEAMVSALAGAGHLDISLVDATSPSAAPTTPSTGEPMSVEVYEELFSTAQQLVEAQVNDGIELLALGDAGRGITTTASIVIGTMCSVEPVRVIGRGSGISDEGWKAKVAVIRDAMYRVRDDRADPHRILRHAGSPVLVMACGILLHAASRGLPVLFDGVGPTAAALCAHSMDPAAGAWWRAASVGAEPGHRPALKAIAGKTVLGREWGLAGGGLAGAAAVPLLRSAAGLLNTQG